MQTTSGLTGTAVFLSILAAALVAAVATGAHIPLIGNGRAAVA